MLSSKNRLSISASIILLAASVAHADMNHAADPAVPDPGVADPGTANPMNVGPADPAPAAADGESSADSQSVADPRALGPTPALMSSAGQKFGLNYYAILYGPSIQDGGILQPSPDGAADPTHPVQIKNFVGASYNLNDAISITPTAFFVWTPVHGQKVTMMDPFLRIGDNQIVNTDEFNLYADVRIHVPVTAQSQQNDLKVGVQSFQAFTYLPQGSRFNAALYTSIRFNRFGKQGLGNDLELYAAPMVGYQLSRTVSLTMLYEMGASHGYGMPSTQLNSDGTDLEPGVTWDIAPSVTVNPYVNLYPGQDMSLRTSSFGMTLSWSLI